MGVARYKEEGSRGRLLVVSAILKEPKVQQEKQKAGDFQIERLRSRSDPAVSETKTMLRGAMNTR